MKRLLALLILFLAIPAFAEDYAARVVGISDGDTITVLTPAILPNPHSFPPRPGSDVFARLGAPFDPDEARSRLERPAPQ
jgi:hypothetical protein